MKKTNILLKLLFIFILFAPFLVGAQATCGSPVFSEKNHDFFSYNTADGGKMATTIVAKYGNNWCSSSNLCPAGAKKATGDCEIASEALKTKWMDVLGGPGYMNANTIAVFNGNQSYYYAWKLCSICPTGDNDIGGGPSGDNDIGGGGSGSGATPATQGTPTTVSVLGFDKLENPLGPANLTTVSDVIERALGIIIKVSIPFVVLMLIWTGFQFVIAQGNASKITAAKNTLLWVIVGAAILIGCVAIAKAIANSVESVAKIASS